MPGGNWQEFNDDLYLDRPKVFRQIIDWITQRDPRKRVLCRVSPPGSGKTWVMHRVESQLKVPNLYFTDPLLIFWLDTRALVDVTQKDRDEAIRKKEALQWIENCYTAARAFCKRVPAFSPLLSYSKSIEILVEALCGKCGIPFGPLVVVDGYDEVPSLHREVISDRLLSPFIGQNCIQMIVAQRDQTGLYHYLLRRQQKILAFSKAEEPIDAFEQFTCFRQHFFSNDGEISEVDFDAWRSRLVHYQWENPLANSFFFDKALEENPHHLSPVNRMHLRECIQMVIERPSAANEQVSAFPHYLGLNEAHLSLLSGLASLDEEFTNEDLEERLNTNVFNDPMIKQFNDWGILLSVDGTIRYKLIDFIRALLLDMEETGNEGSHNE